MTREEMIAALMWFAETGENYYNRVAGPLSTVAIRQPADKYTDEELAAFVEYDAKRNAWYDEMWTTRKGCNTVIFDKPSHTDKWEIDKLTWQHHSWADTQAEALTRMTDWKETNA